MAKQKKNRIRPHHDYEHWYTATLVKKRTEVETSWGTAMAEVGTFILTDSDDPTLQVVCTEEDLDVAFTGDPVPPPPPPVLGKEDPVPVIDPLASDLPGGERHGA